MAVTIEADSEGEIVGRMTSINALHGVLSVALVFHHVEPLDDSQEGIAS